MIKNKFNIIKNMMILGLMICFFAVFAVDAQSNIASAYESTEKYYGEISYSDSYIGKSETETINYATKNIVSYNRVNITFPECYNTNDNLENACANVAGANIINYYDRFFDDFIPDYVSGRIVKDNYVYYPMRIDINKKQTVINTLYTYMRTGLDYPGTTQAMYKQGLKQYVNEKGRNITYSTVFANNKFDINLFVSQIQMGHPVVLYMSGFNLTSINHNTNQDILNKCIYDNAAHIAVAYGYQKVEYFNNEGALIASKVYIEVASGIQVIATMGQYYYILGNNGVLDDAEAVNVY